MPFPRKMGYDGPIKTEEDNGMTLGERVYTRRTALGMSQDKLAEQLEVSRQSVSKWETDASVPDLDKLVKLSELFHMTLDELVRGETAAAPEKEAEQPEESAQRAGGAGTTRVVLGGVLLICGLLTAILLLLLNGGGLGLLIGGCLALAGLMMLLPPVGRLVTLWILWSFIVMVFMPRAMGVKPKWIFSADLYRLCGQYPYFWYLIIAWAEVLTGLSLTAATVRMIRRRKK